MGQPRATQGHIHTNRNHGRAKRFEFHRGGERFHRPRQAIAIGHFNVYRVGHVARVGQGVGVHRHRALGGVVGGRRRVNQQAIDGQNGRRVGHAVRHRRAKDGGGFDDGRVHHARPAIHRHCHGDGDGDGAVGGNHGCGGGVNRHHPARWQLAGHRQGEGVGAVARVGQGVAVGDDFARFATATAVGGDEHPCHLVDGGHGRDHAGQGWVNGGDGRQIGRIHIPRLATCNDERHRHRIAHNQVVNGGRVEVVAPARAACRVAGAADGVTVHQIACVGQGVGVGVHLAFFN